ncbi:hypothetical protein A176_002876 [Myxococcus hansupus]|uniref:Uncharacterized protein n=1 Tax=Pseudomyxococcus hansupus TaxID=1297742 RepID=A0A0H4WT31_9BACT|nr:hypothetical protein [Myxococcus hansupus]AKQ65964.1 hypothetical protein A176_002876 [Myxococcus hansupus]
MSSTPRFPLLARLACVLLCLSGCGDYLEGDVTGRPGPPTSSREFCAVDQDCSDPDLFICDTATARCVAACRTQADCRGERRGIHALAVCDDAGGLGCQCDMNRCLPAVCAADSDCESDEACRDGACVAPPEPSQAASCEVTPAVVVGSPGLAVDFQVWVRDAAGRPLVPREGMTWEALTPSVVGAGTGAAGRFVLAEPASEHAAVSVQVGEASCSALVTVLPSEVATGGVRVLVMDAQTGWPVPLAVVAVSDDDGEQTAAMVTNADGTAWVPARGEVGLTAYHPDFGYLTLARHDASRFRDVRLALVRNPLDRFGGVRGEFPTVEDSLTASSLLRVGVAGLSVPGLPSDQSAEFVAGPEREVPLPVWSTGVPGPQNLSLPSGAALWMADRQAPEVALPGVAGMCDGAFLSGWDPELAPRDGACGTRTAWALTGVVSLADLPLGALQPKIDPLLQLGRLLQGSPRFFSLVARDTRFTLAPTPGIGVGEPDVRTVEYAQPLPFGDSQGVRLSFPFVVQVPSLPQYQGTYLDRAYVLATVAAPGRGLVPLGLGAAANTSPADPNTDADFRLGRPGHVAVRMAPAHGGLEGQPYRLLVAAVGEAPDGSLATSTLVKTLSGPQFDPEGLRPVSMDAGFLSLPESARYNFDGESHQGLEAREFQATVDPRANLVRAEFSTRAGRRWTVLMPPEDLDDGVQVPRPSFGFEDRTYASPLGTTRARLHVEVLRAAALTRREGEGVARLVAADGPRMERLADLTDAVASVRLGHPEVTWLHPEADGQRLARGSAVRLRVTGFRLGAPPEGQGRVHIRLQGGAGCVGPFDTEQDVPTHGVGEFELLMPAGCQGVGATLTATLVGPDGDPLRPFVRSSRRVDIH